MFRILTLWCLIHLSVGDIIRGRVLLDGDAHRNDSIPGDSRLIIRLEQITEEEIAEVFSKEIELSTLTIFPIEYQVAISFGVQRPSSFRLSAQIKREPIFLYVGEETVLITSSNSNESITIDIPVRAVRGRREIRSQIFNMETLSWPELVGQEGTYAVQYIKEKTGFTNVILVPDGSAITMDYRTDRVRVFIDKNGIVVRTPCTG